MAKKTPTKHKPFKQTKRKRRGIIFLTLIFFVLFLCALSTCCGSVFLLASYSNLDIPIFTPVVESIEQTFSSPQEIVEEDRDYTTSMIVEFLEPATSSDGMDYREFTNQVEKLSGEYDHDNQPGKFSYDVSMAATPMKKEDPSSTYRFYGNGTSDKDQNLLATDLNFEMDLEGLSLEGSLEIIVDSTQDDQAYYFKINRFPFLDTLVESSEIDFKDEWMKFSMNDYLDTLNEYEEYDTDEMMEDFNIKLTDKELEEIENILRSEELTGEVRWESAKTFNGKRAKCYSMNWEEKDIEAIVEMVKDSNLLADEFDEDNFKEFSNSISTLKITQCTDRKNDNLYELSIFAELKQQINAISFDSWSDTSKKEETKIELTATILYSDYGKTFDIEIPKDAVDLTEYMNEALNTYDLDSGNTNGFEYNYDFDNYDFSEYEYYYLYYDSTQVESQELIAYLRDNDIFNELDYMLSSYDLTIESWANDSLEYECDQKNISPCNPPILKVISNWENLDDFELIVGKEEVIGYLESKLSEST
ncbi:hypothetical protein JW766_02320 [Candidatus Dojkabacteria bacterium]|nr:hypothetical protein [Candidatus Dojkabacteria bacterium]